MATDTKQETGFQFKDQRLGVAVGERFYPSKPVNTAQAADGGPPLSEFAQKVVDSLRKEMPYFQREGGYADFEQLLDDVLPSIVAVQEAVKDFRTLIRKIAETNIAVKQKKFKNHQLRAKTFKAACREVVEESRCWEALPFPEISSKREASIHLEQHEALFARDLEKLLISFAVLVERTLDRLVNRQVLGVVHWGTEESCDFHFFNTVIIQRVEKRYTVRRELHTRIVHDNQLFTERETVMEDRRRIKGKSEYRHARSNIYLRNATNRPVDLVEHRIPAPFAALSLAIPSWLRPIATCAEGLRCAEEIVVSTTKEEGFNIQDGPAEVWYRTTIARKPQTTRGYIRHCDPALVLGDHYVLAGWGPMEDAAHDRKLAQERAETAHKQRTAQLTHWRDMGWLGGGMLTLLGLILMLFSQAAPNVMLPLGSLSALAAVSLFGYAQRLASMSEGDASWNGVLFTTSAFGSGIVGTYFLTAGIVAGLMPLMAIGAVGLAISGALVYNRARF